MKIRRSGVRVSYPLLSSTVAKKPFRASKEPHRSDSGAVVRGARRKFVTVTEHTGNFLLTGKIHSSLSGELVMRGVFTMEYLSCTFTGSVLGKDVL